MNLKPSGAYYHVPHIGLAPSEYKVKTPSEEGVFELLLYNEYHGLCPWFQKACSYE